jgi:hypothetical protein
MERAPLSQVGHPTPQAPATFEEDPIARPKDERRLVLTEVISKMFQTDSLDRRFRH